MVTTPVPYFTLVALLEVCAFFYASPSANERVKQYSRGFAIFFFFFFLAFRGFIFSDWITYYSYFHQAKLSDVFDYKLGMIDNFEPGFVILNLVCRAMFDEFFFFQFVICLANLVLLLNFFKGRIDNIPFALMLYFVFGGLDISINLFRNSMAIMLFLNALPFLEKRQPVPYFMLCLLGASFHATGLIYLPLYFVLHRKMNRWVYLGIIIACNIIFLLNIPVVLSTATLLGLDEQFSAKLRAYTELYNKATPFSIGYMERFMTSFLVICYYNKLRSLNKSNTIFVNALLGYLIAFFFFSQFDTLSKRLGMLFIFSYWILWSELIKCFSIRTNRKLFIAFVSLYSLVKIWSLTRLPSMEYDNILFGHKSYQERLFIFNRTFEEQ